MEWTYLPLLLLGLPLGGSLLPVVSWRRGKTLAHVISSTILATTASLALYIVYDVLTHGPAVVGTLSEGTSGFAFNVDFLAAVMALLGTSLCLACTLVSGSYGVFKGNGARYLSSLMVLCTALNGIFLSGDLVLMMFFWEMMVI